MVEVRGSRAEIVRVIKGISTTYPADLIKQIDIGEWHFVINGIDVLVMIEEEWDDRGRMVSDEILDKNG